jgi:hypothetical protein
MTKRHHQPDGRSTIYRGADGLWHGRVSMGLTDQGRKDRRHVSSKSKTVVTEKVAEWERAREKRTGSGDPAELDCRGVANTLARTPLAAICEAEHL